MDYQQPLLAVVDDEGRQWDEWVDRATVIVPLSITAVSVLVLFLQIVIRLLFHKSPTTVEGEKKKLVESHGGLWIYASNVIRCLGCLASVTLSVVLVLNGGGENQEDFVKSVISSPFAPLGVAFAYASLLSLFQVLTKGPNPIPYHLPTVLFISWTVLFARDIAPLCTYTLVPADNGPLVWALISVQSFISVLLPLTAPRVYVPLDPQDPMPPNPYQTTSILSLWFFSFLDPLIWKAYTVPRLRMEDLPPLADVDHIKNLVRAAFVYLDPHRTTSSEKKRRETHIFFKVFYIFRRDFGGVAVLQILENISLLAGPFALKGLLTYLQTGGEETIVKPWVWILGFFLSPLAGTILSQLNNFLVFRVTTRLEALVPQLILEHALRIRVVAETSSSKEKSSSSAPTSGTVTPTSESVAESSQSTLVPSSTTPTAEGGEAAKKSQALVGRMNNLISTGMQAVTSAGQFMEVVWSAPIMIVATLFFLYQLLGWSVIVGFAVMVLQMPLPAFVGSLLQNTSRDASKKGDDRIETVTETMSVIRMIKMFGWEKRMVQRVGEKREVELKAIFKRKVYGFASMCFSFIIPAVTMAVTYAIYALVMNHTLDAAIVFTSISLFDLLQWRTAIFFHYVPSLIRGKVSLERISDFLTTTELLDKYVEKDETSFLASDDTDVVYAREIGFRAAMFTCRRQM